MTHRLRSYCSWRKAATLSASADRSLSQYHRHTSARCTSRYSARAEDTVPSCEQQQGTRQVTRSPPHHRNQQSPRRADPATHLFIAGAVGHGVRVPVVKHVGVNGHYHTPAARRRRRRVRGRIQRRRARPFAAPSTPPRVLPQPQGAAAATPSATPALPAPTAAAAPSARGARLGAKRQRRVGGAGAHAHAQPCR